MSKSYPTIRCVATLLLAGAISGAAHAASWKTFQKQDAFTDTATIHVQATGAQGGGFLASCYEGKVRFAIEVPEKLYSGLKRDNDSAYIPPDYRFRFAGGLILRANWMKPGHLVAYRRRHYETTRDTTNRGDISQTVFVEKLAHEKTFIYQIPADSGPVYRISLAGAEEYLLPLVNACQREYAALHPVESARKRKAEQARKAQLDQMKYLQRVAQAKSKYVPAIQRRIERAWTRPQGTPSGLSCTVRVTLLPNGDVAQAEVVESSGNPVFDRSVVNAVYRASPMPLPANPQIAAKLLNISFKFLPRHY